MWICSVSQDSEFLYGQLWPPNLWGRCTTNRYGIFAKTYITSCLWYRKYPPGYHGREGFVRLGDYPSISIFNPDLSSTVKWSSQTIIRSSQRFTRASSKASRWKGCCLMKSCSSLMRTICASLAAVSTVHFSRCSRSLKISRRQSHHNLTLGVEFTFAKNKR